MSKEKSSGSTAPRDERLRDADRSQAAILAAARAEFAEYGLGGARMDRIATRADLNKRLIYYYFSDKEQLFQSVLEQAYLHIREEERKLHLLIKLLFRTKMVCLLMIWLVFIWRILCWV